MIVDEAVFDRFAKRLSYIAGDFGDAATFERVAAAIPDAQSPVFYLEIPPFLFGPVIKGLAARRPDEERASRRREAVRARRGVGTRAQRLDPPAPRRVPDLPDRPLPRQDGAHRDPVPAVRERDIRADLEPQLRLLRPDHDGRELRRRRPRALLRPGRRAARRGREPPHAGGRRGSDGAAYDGPSERVQGQHDRRVPRDARRRPGQVRARAARGLPRDSAASRPTRRPRRTPRCGSRSTTGAGRAFRSSSAPARTCRSCRPSCGWSSAGRRASVSTSRGVPARTSSS